MGPIILARTNCEQTWRVRLLSSQPSELNHSCNSQPVSTTLRCGWFAELSHRSVCAGILPTCNLHLLTLSINVHVVDISPFCMGQLGQRLKVLTFRRLTVASRMVRTLRLHSRSILRFSFWCGLSSGSATTEPNASERSWAVLLG